MTSTHPTPLRCRPRPCGVAVYRAAVLLLAALLWMLPLFASELPFSFDGAWKHVGGRTEKRDMRAAIDSSVDQMPAVLRGLARKRLRRGSKIPRRLTIATSPERIAIRDGKREALASPPGQVTHTTSATGDDIELLHEHESGLLVQYRTTPDGGRRTTYRLDPSGRRLLVEVVTTSHYLPAPVRYELTYERVGPATNPSE